MIMFPPYSLSNGLLVIPGFVTSCCTLVIFLFSGSSRLCDSRHPLHLYVSHLSVYISCLVISRRFPFQLCLSFPSVVPVCFSSLSLWLSGSLSCLCVCVCFLSYFDSLLSHVCLLSFAILGSLVVFCPPGVSICPYLMWVFKSSVFFCSLLRHSMVLCVPQCFPNSVSYWITLELLWGKQIKNHFGICYLRPTSNKFSFCVVLMNPLPSILWVLNLPTT